jgi:anti-anti-sigma factor
LALTSPMSQTLERVISVIADLPRVHAISIRPVIPILRQRHRLPFPVARRYRSGCWRVIEANGELDIQAVPLLRRLVAGRPSHVVFDLRRVTFVDASVMGVLATSRGSDPGGVHPVVRIAEPSRQVRRVLDITGLSDAFGTFPSLGKALAGHEFC